LLLPASPAQVGTALATQPLRIPDYMFYNGVPVPSSVIAFVTTVHAALLVIHVQRARGAARLLVAAPGAGFATLAWVLATPAWLAAGVLAHLVWAVAALTLSRPPAATAPSAASAPAASGAPPPPNAPPAFVPATVLAVIEETDTIRTFRFARPPGFDFEPGQFLMVRVEVSGKAVARCYSISSAPEAPGYLEISVKRQGLVSGVLHDTLRPGGTLSIHPPLGRFTIPAGGMQGLVLIAGGIGITPMISILRHAVTVQPTRRVTLLYSVRERREAAFGAELDWLARRHPQLRVAMRVTAGDEFDGCQRGRIDARFISESVPDPTTALFFICGPLAMIDAVRECLAGLGVAADRVRYEAFEAAAAVAANAARGRAPGEAPGRLRLAVSGHETDLDPSETLLDAAERAGGRIASFCRAGICGTCRTRLVSGEVRCTAEALSSQDRESGYVLPCVAWAAGDCVLEA
jgi:glycine betaine catabolism B